MPSWSLPRSRASTQVRSTSCAHDKIEPALHNGDWSGAAVAAANGLNTSPGSSGRVILLVVLAVIVIAVVILVLVMRYRGRRRRTAELAAARRVDPTDVNALAVVPPQALDDLSRSMVVDVDNALRTSTNELALAIDEFGNERTQPFTEAVNNAKAALAQAFNVRQQLDDTTPETPAQRRELLTRVIVSAARADRELESQTEAFEKLRDLVINAPSQLDGLTQQYVELTGRIAPAEQRMAELHNEFDAAALTSVSGNVAAAKERLAFADRNISTARELATQAVSGQQAGLVDAVHAAESALGQARALLDAVDNAAGDIRHAVARAARRRWPTFRRTSIAQRATASGHRNQVSARRRTHRGPRCGSLVAGRSARGSASADPLGAFGQVDQGRRGPNAATGRPGRRTGHRRTAQPVVRAGVVYRGVAGACSFGLRRHASRQYRAGSSDPARRSATATAGRTRQAIDQPDRGDRPRQCGVDVAATRSHWLMPTCSRLNALIAVAAATTWAR